MSGMLFNPKHALEALLTGASVAGVEFARLLAFLVTGRRERRAETRGWTDPDRERFEGIESTIPVGADAGCARIVEVTHEHVLYTDQSGVEHSIDLYECALNWRKYEEENYAGAAGESACVGQRLSPFVELMTEPRTIFEFQSFEEWWSGLVDPLLQAGWWTFDLS